MDDLNTRSARWWAEKKPDDVAQALAAALQTLQPDIDERNRRLRRHLSQYMNKDCPGWTPGSRIGEDAQWKNYLEGEPHLFLNPARSCVQTLSARIAAQKIRPTFLTSMAGPEAWTRQQQAKSMQKAVEGEWYKGKVYRKAVQVFHDAGIMDLGVMAVYPKDGQVCFERVFPGQIIVPERDYLTSYPRTLYQVAYVSAEVMIARYPKHRKEIRSAIGKYFTESPAPATSMTTVTDIVEVVEGWHLPSSPDAGDGRHVCCLPGTVCLLDEPWTRDHYPFAFLRWNTNQVGFFSQGAMETAEPLQKQLNKLVRRVQDAMHLYSVAKTYAQKGTINPDQQRNVIGDIVEYQGNTPPKVDMPASVNSEVFNFVGTLQQWVYQEAGVSQLSATSQKPPGVESGIALRNLAEMETGRHALLSGSWEDFFCDLADLTVEACKDIGGHKSRYRTGGGYEEIDWSEIDLDRDAYELQVFPTSYLPITPTGRLATVEDLLRAGFLGEGPEGVAVARKLLDFPDLEHETSLATAALEDIDRQIDMMCKGEEQHPEPYMVVQQGSIDRVAAARFRAKQTGYPEDRLQLLQDWIDEAQALLDEEVARRQAQAMAMMPPQEQGGGAMPEPIQEPQAEVPLATPEVPLG